MQLNRSAADFAVNIKQSTFAQKTIAPRGVACASRNGFLRGGGGAGPVERGGGGSVVDDVEGDNTPSCDANIASNVEVLKTALTSRESGFRVLSGTQSHIPTAAESIGGGQCLAETSICQVVNKDDFK